MAVTDLYRNDYQVCAAQLLSVGVGKTKHLKFVPWHLDHESYPRV
ncbi:MAG: hypothetical protein WCO29_18725 [Nostocales cyanobacterium ELA583]|jgi:hypothetical protein